MSFGFNVLSIVLAGPVGCVVGNMRALREEKQKAYASIVPTILNFAFKRPRTEEDETDLAIALSKLWLYANRISAMKMETAVSIMVDPERGH